MVNWDFLKDGRPFGIGDRRDANGTATYPVNAVQFGGENISGHALHQVYGEIILKRDGRRFPLFITADGMWVSTDEVEIVPPRARFYLGIPFRSDGVHLPEFDHEMTPEQFLQNFGGFTVELWMDGKQQTWSFTIDDLREGIDAYKREAEERWLTSPTNRPEVKRKNAA
jgi:hypothetical protein